MDMDRRQVVRAASASFVMLGIPSLFAACRNRGDRDEAAGPESVPTTAPAGAPDRLVLHVEDDAARSADLGRLVGTFLMHGEDEQLAPFAALDLDCASTRELAALAPELAARGDVRAVLIRSGQRPVVAVAGDPPALVWGRPREPDRDDTPHEASVRARNAWLANRIAAAVGADLPQLERRAAEERAGGDDARLDSLSRADAVRRWPWNARLRAEQAPAERATWIAALADVARERWKVDSPEGSTWARSTGCGLEHEKPRQRLGVTVTIGCGMGHTPEISRRFLHFYTAEERNG